MFNKRVLQIEQERRLAASMIADNLTATRMRDKLIDEVTQTHDVTQILAGADRAEEKFGKFLGKASRKITKIRFLRSAEKRRFSARKQFQRPHIGQVAEIKRSFFQKLGAV